MGKLEKVIVENGITYVLSDDDIYYPDLQLPEGTNYNIGKFGHMRCEYLKEFKHGYYMELLLDGRLNEYLHEIDEACYEMRDRLVEKMKEKQGVTEQLKAENQIEEAVGCDDLLDMIGIQSDCYMTLSVSLPNESEMESVLEDARYKIVKRSGFVASSNYRERRKRDLYVLAAGACVTHKFEGDIYDVGSDDGHAVYRYAKPVFMEVRV